MAQSVQIKRINPWHDRLADWLIANPGRPRSEAAKLFNVTESWLSVVINSDAFQDFFRERSREVSDGVALGVREQLAGVASQALDELGRRLTTPQSLQTAEVLQIADVVLKHQTAALAAERPQVVVGVSLTRDDLAKARSAMRQRELAGPAQEGAPALEAEVIDITPTGESSS